MTMENWSVDEFIMGLALKEAERAAALGEVPVGAVITHQGEIIAKAHNQVETLKDPTAHAEVLAITQAANAIGDWRLLETVLYVTKEPCIMCAGAILSARIPRVCWGVPDPNRGGAISLFNTFDCKKLNHHPVYEQGLLEEPCRTLLQDFFKGRR